MFRIKLKELRENKNISQYKLAADLQIAQSTVGSWESGTRECNFNMLIKLADYFNVSIDFLLGRENATKDTSIVKRPDYALSEKFASDYKDLLTDKNFLDITKLCNAVTPEMRAVAFGYIVALFQSRGVNTQSILGY